MIDKNKIFGLSTGGRLTDVKGTGGTLAVLHKDMNGWRYEHFMGIDTVIKIEDETPKFRFITYSDNASIDFNQHVADAVMKMDEAEVFQKSTIDTHLYNVIDLISKLQRSE